MEEKIIYIYKITNTKTGLVYIGQTHDMHERWLCHLKLARYIKEGKKHSNNAMYEDINEFGKDCFEMEEIDRCFDRHKFIIEEYWTEEYKKDKKVYNINSGSSLSEEVKEKIAQVDRKNDSIFQTEQFKDTMSLVTSGENNGMYGKSGSNAVNGRHVFMCDKDGNILKEFVSCKEAQGFLKIKSHVELNKACRNSTEYKGYYWTKQWKNMCK